jgi:predicted RNA-binding protein YlxR (DUF448 family)
MVRVVRSGDGPVEVDLTGKKSGRGAYLCGIADCWKLAMRRGALNRALKSELSAAERERLDAFGATQAAVSTPVAEPTAVTAGQGEEGRA